MRTEIPWQSAVLAKRDGQIRTTAGNLNSGASDRVCRLIWRLPKPDRVGSGGHVRYMSDLAARQPLAKRAVGWQAFACDRGVFFRETTRRDRWHTLAIIKTERT